jgi:hypothetical protein
VGCTTYVAVSVLMVVLIAFISLLSSFVALCNHGRCLEKGGIAFGDIVGMNSVSDLSENISLCRYS